MKPAIFNTDMVRAILDGRKTQTRRRGATATSELVYRCSLTTPSAPYQIGDIIYVREAFADEEYLLSQNLPVSKGCGTFFRADSIHNGWGGKWKPSIHMPKEYARLFLRVKYVRIERLNEIEYDDILDEGFPYDYEPNLEGKLYSDDDHGYVDFEEDRAKEWFKLLWESIYGNGSFNDDYVWVIEFEKITKEEALHVSPTP